MGVSQRSLPAYYWAAFYFLLTGAASGRVVHLLLSGASLALCVWTTIFMAPFVVLLLPVVWAIAPVPRVVRRAAWIGAGATLATLGLAAVNVALGGRFLFFAQELTYTLAMSRENIWFQPLPSYLMTAYWLVYPVLTVFFIVVAWACSWCWRRALDSRERRKVLAVQAQFLVLAGCLVVLSTSLEQSVLQFSFMVMPLAGPMMPALASALFVSWRRVVTPGSLAVSTVVLAINRFIYAMDEFLPSDGSEPVWLSQLFHGVYATRFSPRVYDWADCTR